MHARPGEPRTRSHASLLTWRLVRGLALACHPGPAAAVTVLAGLLTLAAGGHGWLAARVSFAFAAGQLSVGWSNDWIDAARDTAVRRPDKPIAVGLVSRRTVGRAALVALVLTLPLSLLLGPPAGLVHLAAVASAWAYNLRLKYTIWSWAPYAFSFGLLPAIVTLALPGQPTPPGWATAAGALLGVGAHLANVLPDLEDDARTGVRGLPHRLGRQASGVLATIALTTASLLVVLGPPGSPGVAAWVALAVVLLIAAAGTVVALRQSQSRLPFVATIGVAGVDVVLLLLSGLSLTR